MPYDFVLTGGRVIDPGQNLDAKADVAFSGGKVAAVGPNLAREARATRDVTGKIVTPGLIDLHTHVYWGGTSLGVDPGMIAKRGATTTLVDAGSAGPGNFRGFRKHIIEPSPVRILPYINISYAGIFAFSNVVMVGECSDIRLINAQECVRVAREHKDIVVGVKVRIGNTASFGVGVAPLDVAVEAADELGLPVMAHFDYPPPSPKEVLSRLRKGDVLTHCYRPFPSAPTHANGNLRDDVIAARERGVFFDVGHGGGSFSFKSARAALAAGFEPDAISSDVHALSIDGPAYDLLVTMSKFFCLGLPLTSIVRCATTAPAQALRRPDLGSLKPGSAGDASVIELVTGRFEFTDVVGEVATSEQKLAPVGMVVDGAWMDVT